MPCHLVVTHFLLVFLPLSSSSSSPSSSSSTLILLRVRFRPYSCCLTSFPMSGLYSLVSDRVLKQVYRLPGLPSSPVYDRLASEEPESHQLQRPSKYPYTIYTSVFCSLLVLLLYFSGTIDVQFYPAMANTCSRTTAIPKYLPKEEVFHTTASRLQQTNITQSALDHVVDVSKETRALVVVARTHDVTHWMDKVHSDWDQYTYLVSEDTNPNDTLHVPANVGNEAMRYLSFLIDRYDSLPDIIAFRHGHENSWHQTFDSAAEVNNLNLTTIRLRRYQNFQCGDSCSQHIYLAETQRNEKRKKLLSTRSDPPVDAAIYEHWNSWFGVPMPEDVAAACCAQFVVTKAAVYRWPREKYIEWRQWLLVTSLNDHHSGMVFERLWHVIFGMPPVQCESEDQCLCNVYTSPLVTDCPS